MSAADDEPPPDAVELLEMADQLGIVAALEPLDVAPMVEAPAPIMMILLPIRWVPITAPLFEKLAGGRLVAWGRRDSLLGPWTRLPRDERVWRSVEVDWGHSELTLVRERNDWTLTVDGEGVRYGETANREVLATLHNCRVAWVTQAVPARRRQKAGIDDAR